MPKPLLLLAVLTGLSLHLPSAAAATPPKPNFILINIDDLGYADIGPYGSTLNRTPHLDRMAAEGRKLTCHYAAPVCSPSRSALMTGCYPKRVLPISGVLFPAGAVGLNPDEVTVAELLKGQGYATACVGKWHLGDQPEFLPTSQGFDLYYGIPYSNDMGTVEDGSKNNPGSEVVKGGLTAKGSQDETGLKGLSQPPLPLVENHKVVARVRQQEQHDIVKLYTDKATRFIRDHKDGPFFLYLPHTAVHFPLYPGQDYLGKSANGLRGDWVEEMDWSVGRVLDTVRELGLSEKTLVIFTSDNGGPLQHNAVNTPLRGGKASTLEGGVRVCTIAWWPGQVPAGTSTSEITTMMDILPTFAALAGAQVPANRKLDGSNLWPVIAGRPGAKSPHDTFHYYRGFKLEAVRQGPWKLHLANGELYNLDADIGEASNVAAAHPDVVAKLRAVADGMKDDLGLDGIGPGCRPLGKVDNPQPLIHADGTIRAGFEP
jgi:arylsulfatase A